MAHAGKNTWNMYQMKSHSSSFIILSPPQCKGESIWKSEYLQNGSSCYKALGAKFLSLIFHSISQPSLCQPLNEVFVLSVKKLFSSTLLSAIVEDSPTLPSACMSGLGGTKIELISLQENFF